MLFNNTNNINFQFSGHLDINWLFIFSANKDGGQQSRLSNYIISFWYFVVHWYNFLCAIESDTKYIYTHLLSTISP